MLIGSSVIVSSPVNDKITYTYIDSLTNIATIVTSDINGNNKNELVSGKDVFLSVLSPGATKIIYFIRDRTNDNLEIHLVNFDGSNEKIIYTYLEQTDDVLPIALFSSDSQKIAFVAHGEDSDSLFIIDIDGSNLYQVCL